MKPSIGRIVIYVLSQQDVEAILAQRTTYGGIANQKAADKWPEGAHANLGNTLCEGDHVPAIIVKVWSEHENAPCNLRVFLDGTDTLWATSRHQSPEKSYGSWHWPERVETAATTSTEAPSPEAPSPEVPSPQASLTASQVADTPEAPLGSKWDPVAQVFVSDADGSIVQPYSDEERARRGQKSVAEDFASQPAEVQKAATLRGDETAEELIAKGYTLHPDGWQAPDGSAVAYRAPASETTGENSGGGEQQSSEQTGDQSDQQV